MFQFNTIEEVVQDLRDGKLVIVTDDPDRENEGDLICAAEFATRYNVNFMATYAKGLICMPMSTEMCEKLGFRRWWRIIRTITLQLLLFLSITSIRRREFPL